MTEEAVLAPARERARRKRKSAPQPIYEPLDWFLVRAPLLPLDVYRDLSESASAVATEPGSLVPVDPTVRTALAVGGGELLHALERTAPAARDAARLRGKLLRYLIRMSVRPTPYGLFAGVELGSWGSETDLALGAAEPRTRTRPDMEWLLDFVFALEERPEIRTQLRFLANPSAFIHAGRVFLSERAPARASDAGPVSVRATAPVRQALDATRAGPIPFEELIERVLAAPGATREKAEALVAQLWQQTLLLTDLRPPLTVRSPARYVLERLESIPAAREASAGLAALLDASEAWDGRDGADGAPGFRALVEQTNTLHSSPASKTPLQVDTALSLEGSRLSRAVAAEAARAGELLLRLSPFPLGLPQLDGYRHAFEARYGQEREVPLLEVLDPNFGLGPYPGHGSGGAIADSRRLAERQQTLHELAVGALRERQLVVDLDDETVARLELWPPNWRTAPASLDVAVFVAARSEAALDAGEFQLVIGPNIGASAAGRNVGRFADLLSPAADTALAEGARREDAHERGRLFAELVYLPQRLRSANVAVRPSFRTHEIALGTTPGVPPEQVVPLRELVLGVRDGRFVVRWPAREAEVVVSAGHMLNNFQAPAAARLLDDLGRDGAPQISSFDWGPANGFPFLPRVQMGRIVLAPAQWRIDAQRRDRELPPDPAGAFAGAVSAWRARWQVPRHVYLSVADNRLLLDLENAQQVEELRVELTKIGEAGPVALQEAIPAPGETWLSGPGGTYVTELVVPLVLRETSEHAPEPAPNDGAAPARVDRRARLRPPGSDWLFAKLYCPRAFEEDLLAGPLREFCARAEAAGHADGWFFLRYADPDLHVRLRFHGAPPRLLGDLLPELCAWGDEQIEDGLCLRFSLDTYDREVERYGGAAATEAAEALFCADSRAAVELLHLEQRGRTEVDRVALAVLSIDDLLAGLGLEAAERTSWYRDRVVSRDASGPEYRRRNSEFRKLLGHHPQPESSEISRVLSFRREELAPVAERLADLERAGELSQPLARLARSFVHMHCNRLCGIGSPVEEQALGLLLRTREGLERSPVA